MGWREGPETCRRRHLVGSWGVAEGGGAGTHQRKTQLNPEPWRSGRNRWEERGLQYIPGSVFKAERTNGDPGVARELGRTGASWRRRGKGMVDGSE